MSGSKSDYRGESADDPARKNAILIKVDLTTEEAEEEGMVCGGILEVFLEKM